MTLSLSAHLGLARDEYQQSLAAPLSLRQAWLALTLIDHLSDRVFATYRKDAPGKVYGADDLPAYRAILKRKAPALSAIGDLCEMHPGGPILTRAPVSIDDLGAAQLPIGEFMISLYNGQTVERIVIRSSAGTDIRAHDLMADAIGWWEAEFERLGLPTS